MAKKTQQLQIRVSTAEKSAIKHRAAASGLDVSAYVLARSLPAAGVRFRLLVDSLAAAEQERRSYYLADLNDFLAGLSGSELLEAVTHGEIGSLPSFEQNYIAAMVEYVCVLRGLSPPDWTSAVRPLAAPWFATELQGLRPHLLRASPVAFKRRNIFIDSTIGDRV